MKLFWALALSGVLTGCDLQPERVASMDQVVFLTRDGCMNTAIMRANLDVALKTMGLFSDYQVVDLATLNAADPRTGYPTPTVLYRNADVFGSPAPTPPFPEPT